MQNNWKSDDVFIKLIRLLGSLSESQTQYINCKNSLRSVSLEMRRSLGPVLLLLSLNSLVGLTLLSNGLSKRYHRYPTKAFVCGRIYRSLASLPRPTRIFSSTGGTEISGCDESSTVGSISGTQIAKFRLPRSVSHFYSWMISRRKTDLLPQSF